jgi:hypothetical protein
VARSKPEREPDRGQRECDLDESLLRPGGSTHDTYRKDGSECGAQDDAEPEQAGRDGVCIGVGVRLSGISSMERAVGRGGG